MGLVEIVGINRVVFGSVSPMQYIAPQLVKLHYSGLQDIDREKVMSGNLRQLFGL
jgi:predicted TIM-barrel fold metal-dependent hydrolase